MNIVIIQGCKRRTLSDIYLKSLNCETVGITRMPVPVNVSLNRFGDYEIEIPVQDEAKSIDGEGRTKLKSFSLGLEGDSISCITFLTTIYEADETYHFGEDHSLRTISKEGHMTLTLSKITKDNTPKGHVSKIQYASDLRVLKTVLSNLPLKISLKLIENLVELRG